MIYLMRTKLKNGADYESAPEVAEYDESTESSLVLYALRDALGRMNFACRVVVHTECNYVAAAIEQHWPEMWQANDWKNRRHTEVKDSVLWCMILQEMEESGHEIIADKGKHEFSHLMAWRMPLAKALREVFSKCQL